MRYDHITTLNDNLEKTALYFDQQIALHEHEIAKLRRASALVRQLAATTPADSDPVVDMKPFDLPAVAKPANQAEQYKRNREGRAVMPAGQENAGGVDAGGVLSANGQGEAA